jgi:hypothetical protein
MNNELDEAIYEYKKALVDLKIAVEKLTKSNRDKLKAVKRLQPLLGEIIKKINVTN